MNLSLSRIAEVISNAKQFENLLFLLYIICLFRQYLWQISSNGIAWFFSIIIAMYAFLYYDKLKKDIFIQRPAKGFLFWLFIIIPLVVLYFFRIVTPDYSFDVLNMRILFSDRSLVGVPFTEKDFYYGFLYNSLPEMITGIFRHLLGYRLGTIINLLVVIWIAIEIDTMLFLYIKVEWIRYLSIAFIVLSENILFLINNYMIDLLGIPLILQCIYLTLTIHATYERKKFIYISLISGIAVALKLTNLVIVIPIIIIYIVLHIKRKVMIPAIDYFFMVGLFIIPSLPFSLYLEEMTANPFFPLYNNIFQSPYFPIEQFRDHRWGPHGLNETLLWPILGNFSSNRLSEPAMYSGRIGFGILSLAILCTIKRRKYSYSVLGVLFVLSTLLWSFSTGYIRYAIIVDILASIISILVILELYEHKYRILILIMIATVQFQFFSSVNYFFQFEWGQKPLILNDSKRFVKDFSFLLRDYELQSFLKTQDTAVLRDVDVWIATTPRSSGIMSQLKTNIPIVSLLDSHTELAPVKEKFNEHLFQYSAKKMFTICHNEDLNRSLNVLKANGLGVGNIAKIDIPYFSPYVIFNMFILEVLPYPNEFNIQRTQINSALPDIGFVAKITPIYIPNSLKAGTYERIKIQVTNISTITWSAMGGTNGAFQIKIGNHWRNSSGQLLLNDDSRESLLRDLGPNEMEVINLDIKVPSTPGDYIIEIDMVQEGYSWFAEKGSSILSIPIKVI